MNRHIIRLRYTCGHTRILVGFHVKKTEPSLVYSRSLMAALFLFGACLCALAQDAFEIQVYEYETVPKGMWNLETHLNYIGRGTKEFEGPVAPTNNQFHMTYELTRGITNTFEMAGYLVLARRPGGGAMDFAGWRLRPRMRFPTSWRLPVDVS